MEKSSNEISFGKWRRRLWPFHKKELKKFLPLMLIKFLISFCYGILTCMKDTMIVTSTCSGAEVIPVLKGYIVLPIAVVVAIIYSKLSDILNKRQLFYTMLTSFLVVIFVYGFVLYPNMDSLSPHSSSDFLISKLGERSQHWVAVYRNWTQSVLFVTAELWGSMVILVMFWGLANDITSVDEAKRSYNMYIAAGDIAAFSVGPTVCFFTSRLINLNFIYTVQALISIVLASGLTAMFIYWRITKNSTLYTMKKSLSPIKQKEKIGLFTGLKQLLKSRYLLGIAILVVGYGLSANLIDVTYKASLNLVYPNPADYQMFTSKATSYVGLFAFIASVFLGTNIIRKFGWHVSAQITPIVVGTTGICFFLLMLNINSMNWLTIFGTTPMMFIVLFGAFQNVISKVAKYSFFDTTKEMAYIPLDDHAKIKGKAVVDMIGSRLGKSGSAWIQVALIDVIGNGSIFSITHILLSIVVFVTISWVLSVRSLSKRFETEINKQKIPQSSYTQTP